MNGFSELTAAFRRVLNFLNWRLIRVIGQLQILTRASYAMLIIVPLLAGTWPAVRVYVNQHNKRATEVAAKLEEAKIHLDQASKSISPKLAALLDAIPPNTPDQPELREQLEAAAEKFTRTAYQFSSTVGDFKTDFAERTLKDPRLPWSFAAAFFGALFAVLAHFVYQLFAPEMIKATTLDQFVSGRKDDYGKHPSQDALDRADGFARTSLGARAQREEEYEVAHFLDKLRGLKVDDQVAELQSLRRGRLMSVASYLRSGATDEPAEYVRRMRSLVDDILGSAGQAQIQDMTLIERGAKAEYLHSAGRAPIAIIVTGLLYLFAVYEISLIITTQATSVMQAAGWNSVTNLLYPPAAKKPNL